MCLHLSFVTRNSFDPELPPARFLRETVKCHMQGLAEMIGAVDSTTTDRHCLNPYLTHVRTVSFANRNKALEIVT